MAQSVQQGSGVQQQVTLARADGETTSGVGELLANTHHLHLQGGDTRSFQVSENIFWMFMPLEIPKPRNLHLAKVSDHI